MKIWKKFLAYIKLVWTPCSTYCVFSIGFAPYRDPFIRCALPHLTMKIVGFERRWLLCDAFCLLLDAKMWQMSRCIYDTPFTPWWPGFKRIFFVTPTVTHCRRCHSVSKKSHFATLWIFTPKVITFNFTWKSENMKNSNETFFG